MPVEDIGQVLLNPQAKPPGSLVMELKSFFLLGVWTEGIWEARPSA